MIDETAGVSSLSQQLAVEDRRLRSRVLWLSLIPVAATILMAFASWSTESRAMRRVEALERQRAMLADSVTRLNSTQRDLLDFLGRIADANQVRFFGEDVDWPATTRRLTALPAGARKSAVLSTVLLAWKQVAFHVEGGNLGSGVSSPGFIAQVLCQYGVDTAHDGSTPLSAALMHRMQPTTSPEPGDLLFYRGQVGSFVLMYLGPGAAEGNGVAVGHLQSGLEALIVDTHDVQTALYPLIGAYKVPYPAETPAHSACAPANPRSLARPKV